jgi:hypothetical protein
MGNARIAGQRTHVAGPKDIAHLAIALVHAELLAHRGGDAGRVLPPVLQQQQPVIEAVG